MHSNQIWSCDWCGADNHVSDAECQFCDGGAHATEAERNRMAAALSGWVDPRDRVVDL